MTIGKSSKKINAPRSPPFLDRATGFYGRLDEREVETRKEVETREKEAAFKPAVAEWSGIPAPKGSGLPAEDEPGIFDFDQGMMEDDGTTLLKRKPSRMSRRWNRKSSRRAEPGHLPPGTASQSAGTDTEVAAPVNQSQDVEGERQPGTRLGTRAPESLLVHFSVREEADDQVLILERKEGKGEAGEKRRKGQMEEKMYGGNMKVAKRTTLRSYCKVFDRAVRRGWETFVANLYSVTLTPVPSSSCSPATSKLNKTVALVEYR
ncbi:uncharacterized protein sb:cb1058 [Electrophorus electricus]|uniref:uncharacterized protein sb:cb1058 n=1 Tax=Electrophorus electricus TaxID=8005 RepID=UPI0015D02FC3|nr:uncharacterized protein sb:cb1058 [Electrophorus electricus]XP_035375853.1 uncharacterized protein sb:cb1058 [Electrophorus electricus]